MWMGESHADDQRMPDKRRQRHIGCAASLLVREDTTASIKEAPQEAT
jgi:hypothetical protein